MESSLSDLETYLGITIVQLGVVVLFLSVPIFITITNFYCSKFHVTSKRYIIICHYTKGLRPTRRRVVIKTDQRCYYLFLFSKIIYSASTTKLLTYILNIGWYIYFGLYKVIHLHFFIKVIFFYFGIRS